MGSEVAVTSCSKYKEKKTCFKWDSFMTDYISAYKSQMALMRLDLEADKSIMKVK